MAYKALNTPTATKLEEVVAERAMRAIIVDIDMLCRQLSLKTLEELITNSFERTIPLKNISTIDAVRTYIIDEHIERYKQVEMAKIMEKLDAIGGLDKLASEL